MGRESTEERLASGRVLELYRAGRRDFREIDIDDPEDGAPLRGARLDDADFSGCFIVADLGDASLKRARFVGANVKTCCFDGADLREADFSGAALEGASFQGADLRGARFEGATCFGHTFAAGETPEH
ncbi:MAG: pentapeptide repeat-containing protein [Myxococcota bacterium]